MAEFWLPGHCSGIYAATFNTARYGRLDQDVGEWQDVRYPATVSCNPSQPVIYLLALHGAAPGPTLPFAHRTTDAGA
jgi:hypothetical protein